MRLFSSLPVFKRRKCAENVPKMCAQGLACLALFHALLRRLHPSDPPLTTAQMADLIYDGFDVFADEKLFKGLRACADHDMKAYATRGPLEMIGQHMGRRLYWHAPKTFCKECGRSM